MSSKRTIRIDKRLLSELLGKAPAKLDVRVLYPDRGQSEGDGPYLEVSWEEEWSPPRPPENTR